MVRLQTSEWTISFLWAELKFPHFMGQTSCNKETPSNAQCWISLGQTVKENTVTTLSLDIVGVQPSALC